MSLWKSKGPRHARLLLLTAAGALAMAAAVLAQGQASEFVPATDITKESLPATPLLYAAYAFVWAALLAYVFLLWRRLGRVERELADVTARLAGRK